MQQLVKMHSHGVATLKKIFENPVSEIGASVFSYCKSLESIDLGSKNTPKKLRLLSD